MNKEFSYDVDVSNVGCHCNAAAYFIDMPGTGYTLIVKYISISYTIFLQVTTLVPVTGIATPTSATTSGAPSTTPSRATSTRWPAPCTPATVTILAYTRGLVLKIFSSCLKNIFIKCFEAATATGTAATGTAARPTSSTWTLTPCARSRGGVTQEPR